MAIYKCQSNQKNQTAAVETRPSQLKILALMTDAFGGYGGIAQYNRDIVTALARDPSVKEVDVLVRLAPEIPETLPAKINQAPPIKGRVAYAFAALIKAIQIRPQLVFSGHIYHGPLAQLISRLTGAKLISQLHGTEIWGQVRPVHLKPLDQSDRVLCVSRHTKSCLDRQSKLAQSNTFVIPNTVGAVFTVGDSQLARAKFGIVGEKVILTVARLDTRQGYKGHDRIIRELSHLNSIASDGVVYLVAGQGPDLPRLAALAQELGVADKVRFLGKVPNDDLPDLYRAADIFALPSTGEGFGIVFLEAMACGTPAIGLNIGGAPDALADGELGMCVEESDFPAALARALQAPPADRIALSNAVRARFGREAFTERVLGFLSSLNS